MLKGRICFLSIFKKYHLLGVGVVGRPAVSAELVGGHPRARCMACVVMTSRVYVCQWRPLIGRPRSRGVLG